MIDGGTDHEGRVLPKGMMYTSFLTQEMLDECSRALGRVLMSNEVQLLDRILAREVNRRNREGKSPTSSDEMVSKFLSAKKVTGNGR